jgi:small subunit ribosomal protein S16
MSGDIFLYSDINMLTIRLSRVGKKKQPTYRFIISEKTKDPWGDSLEILGHYNPRSKPVSFVLKEDRVKHWIEKGAQLSDTVHNMFVEKGIIKADKRRIVRMSMKKQGAIAEAKVKAAEEAAKATAKAKADAEAKAATPEPEVVPETAPESTPEATPEETPKAE